MHKQEIALRCSSNDELVALMRDVALKGVEYYFPMIKLAQKNMCSFYTKERHAEDVCKFYKGILKIE